jgi:hypothetical protein
MKNKYLTVWNTVAVLEKRFKLAGLIALISLCAITTILTPFVYATNTRDIVVVDANERADRKDGTTWDPKQIRGELWAAFATYEASYIEVSVRKDGSPGDINLIVQEAPGGIPSGNNIASFTLSAKNIPAWKSWVRFNTNNLSFIQGNKYWFGIYASSGKAAVDQYAIGMSEGSSYKDGFVLNSSDGKWQPSETYDCLFRIFGVVIGKTTERIVPPSMAPFSNLPQVTTTPTAAKPTGECSLPWSVIVVILCCLGVIRTSREVLRR